MKTTIFFYKDDSDKAMSITVNLSQSETHELVIDGIKSKDNLLFVSTNTDGTDDFIIIPYEFYHNKIIKIQDRTDPFEQY